MNWRKEGYEVGQEVCLATEMLYSGTKINKVQVIYVGTKVLKIKYGDRIIEFKSSRSTGSQFSFGILYTIYKSEEEYQQHLKLEQEKEILINNIRRGLNSLSLDKLKEINNIIK
ncbi:hypothetical protein ACFHWD_03675 [Clostridium sp. MT-14]|uniref:beta barrel domain-containing protein n=1 Tax=Clostridium sp. MT-14 TaxID=3348360 RepID=UPI0035F43EEA